jgi:multicomponent Na+:H+ antiporter subunit D
MNSDLLIFPVLIPMLTGILTLLVGGPSPLQRGLSVLGAGLLLATGLGLLMSVTQHGIHVVAVGSWPAPYGITLVADVFSSLLVAVTGLVALACILYSLVTIDPEREAVGYHPLYHFLLMGVCGAFLTGDLFNLYVWFEVMLMASFVLMALGGERGQMEGAIKYVTINLVSSAIFLAALGLLYGLTGTLNMADLAVKLANPSAGLSAGLVTVLAMMLLVAFGIKAAVFPLFFWLPASYHAPPPAVSAVFAGLLTKVGVYALIRVFTLIFLQDVGFTHTLILIVAGLTMVTGVLGAVAQNEFRRVLSFHIVSQIGYMVLGLGLFTPLALAGAVFYIVHHIVVKTNLFLIGGLVERLGGTPQLKQLGGLYESHIGLALLFLIPALSLAGLPPLSGFFAKLAVLQAALAVGQYVSAGIALAVGLLTLFSMLKLWREAFWKPAPESAPMPPTAPIGTASLLPIMILAAVTIMIGLAAGPVFALALQASDQLMNPALYTQAVLGEAP